MKIATWNVDSPLWDGQVLFSEPERARFGALEAMCFVDGRSPRTTRR